jgi:hypothetical protein
VPRGLDHIGFTRPSYTVRIKCSPYPLIVKPPYPLYPVRSLGPVSPAGSLGSVSLSGPWEPSSTRNPWYRRGIVNT